jgi:hypothetical protein
MITCESFRTRFHAATEDAALLEHIRTCDRCLDFAASVDPDVMFRALGGSDMVPPGGVDAFVDDVMRQVRVRDAESTVHAGKVVSWPRRLAVAATIAAGITGAMLFSRGDAPTMTHSTTIARVAPAPAKIFTTKPVVESYDSENATIVEVPGEEAGSDVKIVMIFDENLPADL